MSSVGKYKVEIGCYGVQIGGSPFFVSVWDATQVKVYNVPPTGRVGKPTTFNSSLSFICIVIQLCVDLCHGWKRKNRSAGIEQRPFLLLSTLSFPFPFVTRFPFPFVSLSRAGSSRPQIQLVRPCERYELPSGSSGARPTNDFWCIRGSSSSSSSS